jgi:uncharacterized protein (DUF2141 family)
MSAKLIYPAGYGIKSIIAAVLLLCSVSAARAETASPIPAAPPSPVSTGRIIVNITGITHTGGTVGVYLFNSKQGFPGKQERALFSQQKNYSGTTERVVFENIPSGTYAISVIHDENGNGKLDRNFIGIPREGVGVSNNPKVGMGGPKYDQCSFTLGKEQLEMTIAMKYL